MTIAFIDTNALLHYPPLKDVDWCKVCGDTEVTIMLCLPVVKELDKQKSNPRLSDRARARSREIEENIDGEIRPGVTIRFYADPLRSTEFPDTLSPEVVDDQIVHYAVMYRQKHGGTVAIVTEDTLMRLRSRGHGITPISPPENQRLTNPLTDDQKKLRAAESELADLKNRRPKLDLTVAPSMIELRKPILVEPQKYIEELHEKVIADPRLHASGHQLQPYFTELKVWLEQQRQMADESARTIRIDATLTNTGRAPAKGVDLSITFPPSVVAIWHDRHPHGNRLWKVLQNVPQPPGFKVELPPPAKPFPEELSGFTRPVDLGIIEGNTFKVSFDVFPHDEVRTFAPFYVTLSTWEEWGPLPIGVRIRTNEPADLHEFQLAVEVDVEYEH